MQPNDTKAFRGEVMRAVADALDEVGAEIWNDFTNEISTPYPPASKPGQPPHKRSGRLRREITWRVASEVNGPNVELTISSAAPYSIYLRDGTGRMAARDFFQPQKLDPYVPRVADAVVKAIESRFK